MVETAGVSPGDEEEEDEVEVDLETYADADENGDRDGEPESLELFRDPEQDDADEVVPVAAIAPPPPESEPLAEIALPPEIAPLEEGTPLAARSNGRGEKSDDDHMKRCAKICRDCANACATARK